MRWAGCLLCFCVGSLACGGRASVEAAGDAGSNPVSTPDGGPAADCSGLLPAPPGTATAFDVQPGNGESCSGVAIDGEGAVAADAHPPPPPTCDVLGPNAPHSPAFRPPVLFAQP